MNAATTTPSRAEGSGSVQMDLGPPIGVSADRGPGEGSSLRPYAGSSSSPSKQPAASLAAPPSPAASPSRSPRSMPTTSSPLAHGVSGGGGSRPASRLPTIPASGSPPDDEPPSPRSAPMAAKRSKPDPIPIPSSFSSPYGLNNAAAGPSSEGAMFRRPSEIDPVEPVQPSSAPPTPTAAALTHPPEYIHTQHPRRGSLKPLGLNVISPVAPTRTPASASPRPYSALRQSGFQPGPVVYDPNASPTISAMRRESGASTSSTLTQTRPLPGSILGPAGRERRRSSITPAPASLAPPSPTRAYASGKMRSRPTSSDGQSAPPMHGRNHTSDGVATTPRGLTSIHPNLLDAPQPADYIRRTSLPYVHSEWTASYRNWEPSLQAQRGSLDESPAIAGDRAADGPRTDFKFGSGSNSSPRSAAAAALRAIDLSPGSRRSSVNRHATDDVFAQAEAEEAERQRRAFIAATYGADSQRARERLSLGGPPTGGLSALHLSSGLGGAGGSGHSPIDRRPSLMLWEKLGMQAVQRAADAAAAASVSAPALATPSGQPTASFDNDEDYGQRRGSLPIAIPGAGLGRTLSRKEQKEQREADMDQPPPQLATEEDEEENEDEEDEEEALQDRPGSASNKLCVRPQPPLLPLSDPGPRLLPSTLALQRASHLLNSRNLQADPLPHPLPPTFHPPPPVDLAEFDIDFILAGSRAQLGGDSRKTKNAPVDVAGGERKLEDGLPASRTLKLGAGGEDEDSFAKFVGAFDEEYGDRRGLWSFKACSMTSHDSHFDERDPLDTRPARPMLKAEWESTGAGRFELYANGEVRSRLTGSAWRVRRTGPREYELEEVAAKDGLSRRERFCTDDATTAQTPPLILPGERFFLTSKAHHCEHGGIKLAGGKHTGQSSASVSRANSVGKSAPLADRLRASFSDKGGRKTRNDSEISNAPTIVPTTSMLLSQSVPAGHALASLLPLRKKRNSRDAAAELDEIASQRQQTSGNSVTFGSDSPRQSPHPDRQTAPSQSGSGVLRKKTERSRSKDRAESGDDRQKKSGFGGVLKRGIASIKAAGTASEEKKLAREERERERMQSHSWAGTSNAQRSHWVHPSGRGMASSISAPLPPERSSTSASAASASPSMTASSDDRLQPLFPTVLAPRSTDPSRQTSYSSTGAGTTGGEDECFWREGKGWNAVPDDALAMVIPIDSDEAKAAVLGLSPGHAVRPEDVSKQALLVWWVPFDPKKTDDDERAPTSPTMLSSRQSAEKKDAIEPGSSQSGTGTSLPKFQKLLRRRASKDKDLARRHDKVPAGDAHATSAVPASSGATGAAKEAVPLPFRSFRVVARVIDVDDLRSELSSDGQHSTGGPASPAVLPATGSSFESPMVADRRAVLPLLHSSSDSSSADPSPAGTHQMLGGSGFDEMDAMSSSTAPTSNILAGRSFPTVVAVCHSRSQGVEFVLEGLDRLGFCQGDSAWGPTGYEEWRGTGLSCKGRELVDILWVGCTGIMGII